MRGHTFHYCDLWAFKCDAIFNVKHNLTSLKYELKSINNFAKKNPSPANLDL